MRRVLAAFVLAVALVSCGSKSERSGVTFDGENGSDHAALADLIVEVCGQ